MVKMNKYTFELVGYDFMLINSAKAGEFDVRLIEANTNPSIEESNELLRSLIPRMIDDLLKIALDPIFFKPEEIALLQDKHPLFAVGDHDSRENLWT